MFLYRTKRTLKLGIKSLWLHRLRSTLTALGIIFGVASVIAMLAIGEGASKDAMEQIARLGSLNIIVKTVQPPEDQHATGQQQSLQEYGLTYDDAERFRNSIPGIQVIVPIRRVAHQAWYRNRKIPVEVIGTVPWHLETSPIRLVMGRFLSTYDMDYKQDICIIDERVMNELFTFDDPLGPVCQNRKRLLLRRRHRQPAAHRNLFRATAGQRRRGIAKNKQGANAGNIYIPLTTVKNRFGEMSVRISVKAAQTSKKSSCRKSLSKSQTPTLFCQPATSSRPCSNASTKKPTTS